MKRICCAFVWSIGLPWRLCIVMMFTMVAIIVTPIYLFLAIREWSCGGGYWDFDEVKIFRNLWIRLLLKDDWRWMK